MFAEVTDLLGGFQNFILCLVIGLLVITVITLVGFSLFGFEHPFLGWFALFLNDKRRRTALVVTSLLRMIYLGAMIGMAKSLNLTHILVYALFSLLTWGVVLDLFYIIYDLLYSVGCMLLSYVMFLIYGELAKVQPPKGMNVLLFVLSCLMIAVAVGQFFIAVHALSFRKESRTASDAKIKKFSLAILPCLFVVLILPYYIITHTNSLELGKSAFYFYQGEKTELAEGSKLTKTDSGECMVSDKSSSFIISGAPIYDGEYNRVIFTDYCSIVRPRLQTTNRISPMCVLEQEGGSYRVRNGELVTAVNNFFFFDGNDTYYFPEQTVLTFGEETVRIDSFSRVEVSFNQKVEIYNYEKESLSVYENVEGFCMAALFGSEQLNLSTDILYRENGDQQMLFMQPTLLQDLE